VFGNVSRHAFAGKTFVDFPAGIARLAYLETGRTELPNIADADIGFVQIDGSDVLTQGARDEHRYGRGELSGQTRVMGSRVKMHGFFRTAMYAPVSLLVAGESLNAEIDGASDRIFVDARQSAGFWKRLNLSYK
jgi:hypothetical protein